MFDLSEDMTSQRSDYAIFLEMTFDGSQQAFFSSGPARCPPASRRVEGDGWPLSAADWDAQVMFFLSKGYRAIAHDRRGHGRSTQTAAGHDMDTHADDAYEVVKKNRSQGCRPHRPLDRRRRIYA